MSDLASRITKPDGSAPDADAPAVAEGQVDGTTQELGGSGLEEPDYEVEVSLSALQENEATPFHSAASWEDVGLYDIRSIPSCRHSANSPKAQRISFAASGL